MAQTGDWITPRLWGQAWFEKPALLYWMTAAAFKAGLGPDLAPRLPLALASVAFLIFFFFALRREFGERAAGFAALILATSAAWLAYSHVAVPDLPMSAAFAASMLLLMPAPAIGLKRASAAGVLLGLAILAKGLVPLVLFVPALWFLRREIPKLFLVVALAAAVAAPWYVLVASRNGAAFFGEFFGKQQFARFLSGEFLHVRPFWFYVPVLAAELFPWTPVALLLFSKRLYEDQRVRFLLAWFAFGFVFFSASRGKLPGYLLPLLPPMAALLGLALDQARERSAIVICVLAASAGLLGLVPTAQEALPEALVSGLARAPIQFFLNAWLILVALSIPASILLERRGKRGLAAVLIAALTTILVARFVWQDFPALDRGVSARGPWVTYAESIACVPRDRQFLRYGLNYYAQRALPDCN